MDNYINLAELRKTAEALLVKINQVQDNALPADSLTLYNFTSPDKSTYTYDNEDNLIIGTLNNQNILIPSGIVNYVLPTPLTADVGKVLTVVNNYGHTYWASQSLPTYTASSIGALGKHILYVAINEGDHTCTFSGLTRSEVSTLLNTPSFEPIFIYLEGATYPASKALGTYSLTILYEEDTIYKFTMTSDTTGTYSEINIKAWQDVSLYKDAVNYSGGSVYIPYLSFLNASSAFLISASSTPTALSLPLYDANAYLYSTTPTSGDSSTKVATTAFVSTAISGITFPVTSVNGSTGAVTTTDEKVKQVDINGTNSSKGILLSYSSLAAGGSVTNTVYATRKLQWNDDSATLSIYNSNASKYGNLKYNSLNLANDSTSYKGTLRADNVTADRTYTLPDKTGTIALTSDVVDEKLKTVSLNINSTFYPIIGYANSDAETKYYSSEFRFSRQSSYASLQIGQVSDQSEKIGQLVLCSGSHYTYLKPPAYNAITMDRVYTLPDASGTIALTSDLTDAGVSPSIISDVEADSTADKAYAAGDVFYYDDKLYRATAAISLGGTITPNTNCVETTIMEELYARCAIMPAAGVSF